MRFEHKINYLFMKNTRNIAQILFRLFSLSLSHSYFWMIVKPQRIQSSWKFWNDNQIAAGYEQIDNRVTGARNTTKKNEYTVKQMITLMQVSENLSTFSDLLMEYSHRQSQSLWVHIQGWR